MKSIVLRKVVHISDEEEVCFCDEEYTKTCALRIQNDLPCMEMIVRFTPVRRDGDDTQNRRDLGEFSKVNKEFIKTLDHLERIR